MPSVTANANAPRSFSLKPRFEVYREISLQIRAIFAEYTPLIGPLSLDDAFARQRGTIIWCIRAQASPARSVGAGLFSRAILRSFFSATIYRAGVFLTPNMREDGKCGLD